jgi:small-conductance mechanosensitive channel
VLSQPIINYTRADFRRVDLNVSVPYEANPEMIRTIILDETKQVPGFVESPEPLVLFHTMGASSIDLTLLFWVDTKIRSNVEAKDIALTRIKQAFASRNIEVAYPVQVQMVREPEKKTTKRKTK